MSPAEIELLGAAQTRALAEDLQLRPSKSLGQNFVIDPNTVRRIARLAGVEPGDRVLEIGPGLGSLTLALLERGADVVAVEVDGRLAERLPTTARERGLADPSRLVVVHADACRPLTVPGHPQVLVANLPYNVAVPVLLQLLQSMDSLERALVMVQREVGERLAASPGSRIYGVPSVKAQWYADVELAGDVPRAVFWPVPNVDSVLVRLIRRDPPSMSTAELAGVGRARVFEVVDAAFAQRRKSLRGALRGLLGPDIDAIMARAGINPALRGEQLSVADFARIAHAWVGDHPQSP